jgi:hypothetical protein
MDTDAHGFLLSSHFVDTTLVLSATLNTNVFVSALQFGGAGAWLVWLARTGNVRLDTSDAISDETIGVLRDK